MRHIIVTVSILSTVVLADVKSAKIEVYAGISPTPVYKRGYSDRSTSYAFGLSFPFPILKKSPKFDSLRFGVDFTGMPWVSHELYNFEKYYPLNQEVGKTANLFKHFFIGFTTNISWRLISEESLWHQTTFVGGIFWAFPALPLESDDSLPISSDSTTWDITHKVVPTPYVRLQRPLFKKHPFVIGMTQFAYVPEAGLVSSLLMGLHFRLWK